MKLELDVPSNRFLKMMMDNDNWFDESCRSMRKLSLYFPSMNTDILDELKEMKRRVDKLIAAFETLETNGESNEEND